MIPHFSNARAFSPSRVRFVELFLGMTEIPLSQHRLAIYDESAKPNGGVGPRERGKGPLGFRFYETLLLIPDDSFISLNCAGCSSGHCRCFLVIPVGSARRFARSLSASVPPPSIAADVDVHHAGTDQKAKRPMDWTIWILTSSIV
jgi:hypothetical protein